MVLGSKLHTVGNSTRWIVDYGDWLDEGRWITAVTVTSSSLTATVTNVLLLPDKRRVQFFLNGGVLSEVLTVKVQVTDSLTQVEIDTITFTVVAP